MSLLAPRTRLVRPRRFPVILPARCILPGNRRGFHFPLQHGVVAQAGSLSLFAAITSAGLTTNLKWCGDASSAASYSAGQKWLDLSGNGYDFFLGDDGTVEGDDPIFVGTPGGLSSGEYFTGDATPRGFVYDSANEAWMENLHKDNAIWSGVALVYLGSAAPGGLTLFCTMDNGNNTGARWEIGGHAANKQSALVTKTGNVSVMGAGSKIADTALTQPGWHFIGVSVNEPAGAASGFLYKDGGYDQVGAADTFDATYTAPSAGAASSKMTFGKYGVGDASGFTTNSRIAASAIWEGTAISKANMDSIRTLLQPARAA